MAVAAMPEAFDQIRAAVPRCRSARIGAERARGEEEFVPDHHGPALIEGKAQLVDVDNVPHGLEREQIRIDGVAVRAGHPGEEGVGHRRKHVLPALVDAVVQRTIEVGRRPAPDAGLGIGRDVGCKQEAEWRVEAAAARIRRAAGGGVARNAIARSRQIRPALHRNRLRMRGPWQGECDRDDEEGGRGGEHDFGDRLAMGAQGSLHAQFSLAFARADDSATEGDTFIMAALLPP